MQPVPGELSRIERLVRHERWIIATALGVISLLSWIYIVTGAGTGMSAVAMSAWDFPPRFDLPLVQAPWSASYALLMLLMWWVMMVAMMIPSAAPMILLYARIMRNSTPTGAGSAVVATAHFAAGYLGAWLLFSLVAVLLQYLLERVGLLHGGMMWSTSPLLSALLLIGAGLYQLSLPKTACLHHCRAPAEFLSRHWRGGHWGALRMGIGHGAYCVGCCWSLMALLFVGGVMNLVWMAGLGILVTLEKLLPVSRILVFGCGFVLIGSGLFLLLFRGG